MAGTAENAGQAATEGCHGAWQSLAIMAEEERLADPPAVQGDEALPMTLGGGLVVAPALGEGEAMVDAHLDLELAAVARLVEQRLELLDHVRRRQLVVLGAGDVELALRLAEGEMRALDRLAHQPRSVERSCSRDAVREAGRRGQRIRPAHAIAVRAHRALLGPLLRVGVGN